MARPWPTVLVLLLAVVVVAAAPGAVFAADDHAAKKAEPNIFEPRLDLTLWTIVVFAVLLAVLWKFAWGPMLEGLHKREELIQGAIDEARRAKEDAERLRAEFEQEMTRAHAKAQAIYEEARRQAQEMAEQLVAKARSEIQTERDRLRREIEIARDQALQELWNRTAQLATLISAKALRRQLTPDDQRRLTDEAMAELRQTGNGKQHA